MVVADKCGEVQLTGSSVFNKGLVKADERIIV